MSKSQTNFMMRKLYIPYIPKSTESYKIKNPFVMERQAIVNMFSISRTGQFSRSGQFRVNVDRPSTSSTAVIFSGGVRKRLVMY